MNTHLATLDAPGGSHLAVDRAASVEALIAAGNAAERQAQYARARALYDAALRRLEGPADAARAAALMRWTARALWEEGDREGADDCLEGALAVAQAAESYADVAHALNLRATHFRMRGEVERALADYSEARHVAAATGEPALAAMVDQNLGIVESIRGDYTTALAHYERSLAGFRAAGQVEHIEAVLNNLGMVYTEQGLLERADECYAQARESCARSGNLATQIWVEVNRTDLLIAQRRFAEAKASCEAALDLSIRLSDPRVSGKIHRQFGHLYRETGSFWLAEDHLRRAAAFAAEREDTLLAAEVAREQADLFWQQQRNQDTLRSLNHAHRLFQHLQARGALAEVDRKLGRLEALFLQIVQRWGESIESADHYTQGHCVRVADYACALARRMGMDEGTLFWFRMGALLHDVGKIVVPRSVLNKPGPFTPEERTVMEMHPTAGVELLADIEFPWDIRPMVHFHHERWGGGGYPTGIRGEEIPLAARILSIADVFDALTSPRPYRPAFSPAQALEMMTGPMGDHFDPALLRVWQELLPSLGVTAAG